MEKKDWGGVSIGQIISSYFRFFICTLPQMKTNAKRESLEKSFYSTSQTNLAGKTLRRAVDYCNIYSALSCKMQQSKQDGGKTALWSHFPLKSITLPLEFISEPLLSYQS